MDCVGFDLRAFPDVLRHFLFTSGMLLRYVKNKRLEWKIWHLRIYGTALDSHTHKVALTQSTINANKRFFEKESDVPGYAYTMGLASIMKAKKIVLLAFGEDKAEAVKNLVTATEPTEDIPSTVLVNHPNVTIIEIGRAHV